jgi:hypothetical protein
MASWQQRGMSAPGTPRRYFVANADRAQSAGTACLPRL